MSFASHRNFGQQWPPGPSPAPAPDDRHPSSYHPQHTNIPPPIYGANAANYYSNGLMPNVPNPNGLLPPNAPLPFSNAIPPPYPPYGAPPVPPLGFLPFPQAPGPHTSNEYISGVPSPGPASNIPAESDVPRSPVESSEASDNEREEGELSNGELEDAFINDGPSQIKAELQDTPAQANNNSNSPSIVSNSPEPALQHRQPVNTMDNNPNGSLDAHANDTQMSDTTMIENNSSALLDTKSPAQLRALAQGALLNLAPHNIRFNELVEEGLDPAILKSLYDGIGIRVTELGDKREPYQSIHVLPVNQESDIRETTSGSTFSPVTSGGEGRSALKYTSAIEATASTTTTKDQPADAVGSASKATASSKPLERKDLIARMLAAKAGKSGPSGTVPGISASQAKEVTQQPTQSAGLVEDATMEDVDGLNTPSASAEVRVKEINMAQTELAKQRMERLKKEGLRRSQAQTIADSGCVSTPTDSENGVLHPLASQSASASSQQAALRHPLPDRPPEPEAETSTQIPGLFMTSSEPTAAAEPAASADSSRDQVRARRKRPRASDFTDDIELSSKKPQGSRVPSSEQRVIINISDDEESMYGSDDDNAAASQPSDFEANVASQSTANPPLRNHSLHPATNGNSHISNSTASSLPQTPKKHRHLQMEIDQLRQQIAERERRRSEKLAADQTQADTTPAEPITAPSDENQNRVTSDSLSESVYTQFDPDRVRPSPNKADDKTSSDVFGASEEPNASGVGESAIGAETRGSPHGSYHAHLDCSGREDLRLKLLRRKEIESGLPALDAELLKSEARLAEFMEEQKRLEAEIAKGRAGRFKLMEELEGLGIETEGLTIEELQQAKGSLENNGNVASNIPGPHEPTTDKMATDNTTARSGENPPADTTPESVPASSSQGDSIEESYAPELYVPADSAQPSDNELSDRRGLEFPEEDRASRSSSAMDESMGSEADSEERSPVPEARMDLSTEPIVSASSDAESEAISPGSMTSGHLGSKSCLRADSEQLPDRPPPEGVDEKEVASREASVASEAYEPPEPSTESPTAYSPPFSPAPPDSAGRMDIESAAGAPIQDSDELTSNDQHITTGAAGMTKDEHRPSNKHFTPYESPLSRFRAYRYHPQYPGSIEGGFRSLTYSHNINPHNPLCAYEASGGVCNDRSCQNQHFRDMGLSDDKILVEMGSLREGKSAEQQEEYVSGLRQIINDMRRDKVKDFNTVATEIAAYRRRFLKDPSRVLAL